MMDPTFQNYKCSIVLYFVLHSFIPKIELVICNALKICPESLWYMLFQNHTKRRNP